jgi:hypothetical protein
MYLFFGMFLCVHRSMQMTVLKRVKSGEDWVQWFFLSKWRKIQNIFVVLFLFKRKFFLTVCCNMSLKLWRCIPHVKYSVVTMWTDVLTTEFTWTWVHLNHLWLVRLYKLFIFIDIVITIHAREHVVSPTFSGECLWHRRYASISVL